MIFSTRLGKIEVDEAEVLTFEAGIPGFEPWHWYALIMLPETQPVQWLISLESMEIAFPVLDPWLVKKDYAFDISQDVVDRLDIKNREKILVTNMVRIPQNNPQEMTINLLAPIIVNTENRKAMQLVLDRSDYSLRHMIREEANKPVATNEGEICSS